MSCFPLALTDGTTWAHRTGSTSINGRQPYRRGAFDRGPPGKTASLSGRLAIVVAPEFRATPTSGNAHRARRSYARYFRGSTDGDRDHSNLRGNHHAVRLRRPT